MIKHALAVCSVVVLAACSTTQDVKPESTSGTSGTAPPSSSGSSSSTSGTSTANPTGNPVLPPSGVMPSARSVYFDFDSNVIKDEFTGVVQAHARYLTDNRTRKLRIEGNTDERGSREYNLALGQRRADSVRRSLNVMGIAESRIETVSYGEEKPVAPGHDEAAWSKNRRADLKYDGEK